MGSKLFASRRAYRFSQNPAMKSSSEANPSCRHQPDCAVHMHLCLPENRSARVAAYSGSDLKGVRVSVRQTGLKSILEYVAPELGWR